MKYVCSECKAGLEREDSDDDSNVLSHGLCDRCSEIWGLRLTLEQAQVALQNMTVRLSVCMADLSACVAKVQEALDLAPKESSLSSWRHHGGHR